MILPVAMAAPVQRQPITMEIVIPPNTPAGAILRVQAPDGRLVQVQVPPNCLPGQKLMFQV